MKLAKWMRDELQRRKLDILKMPEDELDKWVVFLIQQYYSRR